MIRLPDRAIFKWVRNTKLTSFIDAYHAPFVARNRYWTGLLLLARVVLHLTAALNVSGEPSVNLLAVSLVMGGILLLQGYSGIRIYKKSTLNVLELTSYFNILAFSIEKYYVLLTDGDHLAIAYVSVTVEFVIFLCVLVHHATVEFNLIHRIKQCKMCKSLPNSLRDLNAPFLSNQPQLFNEDAKEPVTFSEVSMETQYHGSRNSDAMLEQDEVTSLFD